MGLFWCMSTISGAVQIGEETNPLRLRCSSDDFSDGMNDTEQQPDEEGKSSDETAYD